LVFFYKCPADSQPKKIQGKTQAGGQKGRGSGGRNFCSPALSAEGGLGVGSGSSLRQQGGKVRKNCFLLKEFFARPH
jgi:hypothetical protein